MGGGVINVTGRVRYVAIGGKVVNIKGKKSIGSFQWIAGTGRIEKVKEPSSGNPPQHEEKGVYKEVKKDVQI